MHSPLKKVTKTAGFLVAVFVLFAVPSSLLAAGFNPGHYEVKSGDVNGDGATDLLFLAQDQIVIIASDINIPIVTSPDIDTFVIESDGSGGYTFNLSPSAALIGDSAWVASTHDLLAGDTNGDGDDELLVKPNSPGSIALLIGINGSGAPYILQDLSSSAIGYDLGAADTTIELTDSNGDGRDDLYIRVNGVVQYVAPADSTGLLQFLVQTPPAPAAFSDPGASATSDAIGSTEGNFRVSENGMATYSIPIAVAAGTAGVAPTLSLNYTGSTQNGIAGIGWSLGGLSSISRCRQTMEQDGQAEAIDFTANDRFCLDGQRLIKVSGTNYGDANSTYHTEIQSGVVVTIKGAVNDGPDYFEVSREDGSISYYGRTATNSDETAELKTSDGKTLTWGIREYRDSAGNSIWFEYEGGTSAQRIKNIKYAYGSAAGPSSHNARVEFIYPSTDRSDPISGYVGGYPFENKKRLDRIKSYNKINGTESLIREYIVDYQSDSTVSTDKLSRVEAVQECAGATCLSNDTTFLWNLPDSSTVLKSNANLTLESSSSNVVLATQFADINGDGKLDVVWFYGAPGTYETVPYLKYALSNGSTFSATNFDTGFGSGTASVAYTIRDNNTKPDAIVPIDYNADGRQDIAIYDQGSDQWKIHLSKPQSDGTWKLAATPMTNLPFSEESMDFVDINSDGLIDAVEWWPNDSHQGHHFHAHYLQESGDPVSSDTYYEFGPAAVISISLNMRKPDDYEHSIGAPDFDGDGRVDLLKYGWQGGPNGSTRLKAFINIENGGNLFANLEGAAAYSNDGHVIDANSDGLSDIIYGYKTSVLDKGGYALRLSNGDSFEAESLLAFGDVDFVQSADWNSDGHTDLIFRDETSSHKLTISYWNPTSGTFDAPVLLTYLPGGQGEYASVVDLNADGVDDIVHIKPSGSSTVVTPKVRYTDSSYTTIADRAVNRIKKITNGLGAETSIWYESISNSSTYDRLKIATSASSNSLCEPGGLGAAADCVDAAAEVPNSADFYTTLNSDLWVPYDAQGTETLGKVAPTLEVTGPYYVVIEVAGTAPAAGTQPGNIDATLTSLTKYRYADARLQTGGRGFLGFRQLTTIDHQTGVETTTRYRQDWPFVGMPIGTVVKSTQGKTLSLSTTDWSILEWSSTYESDYKNSGSETAGPIHAVQSSSSESSYALVNNGAAQGTKMSTVTTSTDYDAEANATSITVTTEDGNGQSVRTVTTTNTYDSSFPLREARLDLTTVVTSGGGLSDLTRQSAFSYYTGTRNAKGSVYGLLKTETIEPNDPAFKVETTHSYDYWGNRDRSKVVGGSETRCDVDVAIYDSTGRYIDVTKDCLGRTTSTVTARNKYGQVETLETNVGVSDTVTSSTRYGALGRAYYAHNETGGSTQTYLSTSTGNCPSSTVFKVTKTNAGGAQTAQCTDALARPVRELTLAFDGTWNAVDTEYDNLGRVKRKSEPYNLASADPGAPFWTTFGYDILGRVTSTTLPDGSTGSMSYTGSATSLTTVTTNDFSQTRTEVTNVLGQLTDAYRGINANQQYGHTYYEYDHQDNLTLVRDNAGNETTASFDKLGRKEWVDDPDTSPGTAKWTYSYNHFGELTLQTDAKGQTSTMTYDGLGRMLTRVDKTTAGVKETDTAWFYDTAPFGLGQVDYVEDYESGYHKASMYDSLGRLESTATSIGVNTYHELTTYDEFGRVFQYFDAAGDGTFNDFGIVNGYNAYGYLKSVGDALVNGSTPRTIYQQIESMNARGQVTKEIRGITGSLSQGAAEIYYTYVYATGRADTIKAFDKNGWEIQDLDYDWDTLGNLTQRKEMSGSKNLSESFGYDGLNRLISYGISSAPQSVTYDSDHLGNIKTKTGVSGSYQYGNGTNAGPHAVTSFNGSTYTYDGNGNNISGGGRTITYTTFDKPDSVTQNGHTTEFEYGPDRGRYYREDSSGAGITETWYLGSVEIVNRTDGKQERRRYIGGVAIETSVFSGSVENSRTTRYLFHDHLGSIDVITDDQGSIEQELSFNAWGERRSGVDWTMPVTATQLAGITSVTKRGYTGHEALDEVGLIHMNGRIYDPFMARFVQADSIVQDPTNSQSLNRYSYVWNNPLNATDPSGHVVSLIAYFVFVKMGLEGLALAVAMAVTGMFEAAISGAQGIDILIAGIAAGAMTAIGGRYGGDFGFNIDTFKYVVASGVVGGVTTTLSGGKFGHGFRSSIVSAVAGGTSQNVAGATRNDILGFVTRTVAGGTASRVSGGKFVNGALSVVGREMLSYLKVASTRPDQRNLTNNLQESEELPKYVASDEDYRVLRKAVSLVAKRVKFNHDRHSSNWTLGVVVEGEFGGDLTIDQCQECVNPMVPEGVRIDGLGMAIGYDYRPIEDVPAIVISGPMYARRSWIEYEQGSIVEGTDMGRFTELSVRTGAVVIVHAPYDNSTLVYQGTRLVQEFRNK